MANRSLNKQAENAAKGQARTESILLDGFWLHWLSVDVEGRDVLVEPKKNSLVEIQDSKKRIRTLGIVQAKFFEGSNEVKIAREYVEDIEGIKTDFFCLLHTDGKNGKWHNYFFTALEVTQQFQIRSDDKGKQYYIFRLTRNNSYSKNKDIVVPKINQIISDHISKTDEYRNEEFIRNIEAKFFEPSDRFRHNDLELWASIKDKHIVDKLFIALNTFIGFRHVLAWRQTEKISFKDKINTHTHYQNFTLKTDNSEIINFFKNIQISNEIKIKSRTFFKGVTNAKQKVEKIIFLLNNSNINEVEFDREKIHIRVENENICNCVICSYENLNFYKANEAINQDNEDSDIWEKLTNAFVYFNLGNYEAAKLLLNEQPDILNKRKEFVASFISQFNLEILRQHVFDRETVNLYFEVLKLPVSAESREILKSISEHTLLNNYRHTIDEHYLKIKDYKQRYINNSTFDTLNRQRVKLIECFNFFRENRIIITEEFHLLFEKHVECCAISYSMKEDFRNHLAGFDDFIIKIIILYCDPQNLIGYIQRNNITEIKHLEGKKSYFNTAVNNFFSYENISYLKSEILYIDNTTKNVYLRIKSIKNFSNICLLLCYLEFKISKTLMNKILLFIKELDFRLDEFSYLAHPILRKPESFSTQSLLSLIKIIIAKGDSKGYLLTNCLYALEERKFQFNIKNHKNVLEGITSYAIASPEYGILRPFSKLLSSSDFSLLNENISNSLTKHFDDDLFYESVISNCITDPNRFIDQYCHAIDQLLSKERFAFGENYSAYIGVNNYVLSKLNSFVEIVYVLNDNALNSSETIQRVENYNQYFKFLLNIEDFKTTDIFNMNWLLEITSQEIFNKLQSNTRFVDFLKSKIKTTNNKNLQKLYFTYFIT